jgi:hypothetical protein
MNPSAALTCMEENLSGFQARLASQLRDTWTVRTGNLCASYLGIPHVIFNSVLRSNLNRAEAELLVTRFELYEMPWGWFVSPTSADHTTSMLDDLGFVQAYEMPNMARDLRSDSVEKAGTGLRIERVGNPKGFHTFLDIVLASFQESTGLGTAMSKAQNGLGYSDQHPIQNFLGYEGDIPVCSATLYINEGVVGIYAVATLEQFRGKGYGGAITAHCMSWGQTRGARLAVLQASKMGLPVYQKLGFVEVGPSVAYIKP